MFRALVIAALLASCGGRAERPANPTCVAPPRQSGGGEFAFEERFSGLGVADAIALTWTPSVPGTWYVAEQDGRILRFSEADPTAIEVVLDIRGQVQRGGETGLLGVAFHPDFAGNGQIFVNYTADAGTLVSRIARFTSSDQGASFGNEQILFEIEQPFSNHNAGGLAFGPDGYLYFGLGDGGSGGDPLRSGQDLDSLLGKMLRIDVDGGSPYRIPADNPFASGGGAPEIYAWGLRNPWRFSFDSETGELWLGDVGQNDQEEVDLVVKGGNYGWNTTEGNRCFEPSSGCDKTGLAAPVATYPNTGSSVVGGVVYRGTAIVGLEGRFLFNDFYSGDTYAVLPDGTGDGEVVARAPGSIVHWTEGPDGEVWALGYDGTVHTLVPHGAAPTGGPPALLSQTGCVDAADPTQVVAGAVAYPVAHPFWSDDADKQRWLAIPDGTNITIAPDGDWLLPEGTVLIKEFQRGGERIETRLMIRHEDGGWAGYSYRWREDGSDADLLAGELTVDVDGPWTVPSRSGCLACHTEAANGSLGIESGQLGEFAIELARMGMVDGLDKRDDPVSWPDDARTWLHVNCSSCHRPEGGSRTDLDFRRTAPLSALGLCQAPEHGDLDIFGAEVIAPGSPERSVLLARITTRGTHQMPPLGSHRVDEEGAARIASWIAGLEDCP